MIIGIFAHVDAGKTTLTESLLYNSNMIKKQGRIDDGNTVLDSSLIERERGITIHCNGTYLEKDGKRIYVIDTPGHIDFAPEAARAFASLDVAVIVVSASDGINSHTRNLYSHLEKRNIPVVFFVNKMDMGGIKRSDILGAADALCHNAVDFNSDSYFEDIATLDEGLTEFYLQNETLNNEQIAMSVLSQKVTPVFWGSALKDEGVKELLEHLFLLHDNYQSAHDRNVIATFQPDRKVNGASDVMSTCFTVYRISHDSKGQRRTHIALKTGRLAAKSLIGEEKINEIRIYNGERFETVASVESGSACVVTGLSQLGAGDCVWVTDGKVSVEHPANEFMPVMSYKVVPKAETDSHILQERLRYFEDEMPELHVTNIAEHGEVRVMLMGEIHAQIVAGMYEEKYGEAIDFAEGTVLYKETIEDAVTGIGHYEPLKHYAEARIRIEGLKRGSGIEYESTLSQDILDINWQRLIMTHLKEKEHLGVLTGSPITDVKYTLVGGKSHLKHTEGGDFRQATYRAVRQGLMQAKSVLLEPLFAFEITVEDSLIGRVMSDIERKHGTSQLVKSENGTGTLTGTVPVATMWGYERELASFSKGEGSMSLQFCGYNRCHNEAEIIESMNYNPKADIENTPDSIFCSHGAGHNVSWNEVLDYCN